MGPAGVVVPSPLLDDDPAFLERIEDLAVEQLSPHPGVETLDVAILPRRSGFYECGLRANGFNPGSHILGNKLRPVVAPNECRRPTQDEKIRKSVDHVGRVQLSLHPDRQAFAAELIQDVQRPERLAVIGSAMDKVIGSDVVATLRSEADA